MSGFMDRNGSSEQGSDYEGGPRGRGRSRNKFGRFGSRPKRLTYPDEPLEYKNIQYLSKFVGPTGKILSRRRTGFSGQHQRELARAIKLARFMSLMPYAGFAGGDSPRSGTRYSRFSRPSRFGDSPRNRGNATSSEGASNSTDSKEALTSTGSTDSKEVSGASDQKD